MMCEFCKASQLSLNCGHNFKFYVKLNSLHKEYNCFNYFFF